MSVPVLEVTERKCHFSYGGGSRTHNRLIVIACFSMFGDNMLANNELVSMSDQDLAVLAEWAKANLDAHNREEVINHNPDFKTLQGFFGSQAPLRPQEVRGMSDSDIRHMALKVLHLTP